MRHRRKTKKLSRSTANRKALLRSLSAALIIHERISTTYEKAKEASILADKLITMGKRNTITSKKTAISMLGSKSLVNKLCDDIAPRFANRKGGYTRVLQLGRRKGDGAKMAILELTERKIPEKTTKKTEKRLKAKKDSEKLEKAKTTTPKEKEQKGVPEKEKPHIPETPKKASVSKEEKVVEEKAKEKTKSEKEKIQKGFFKGLRRYFRGKSN